MLICPYYFYQGAMWRRSVLHDHLWTMECNLSHTLGSISWSLWFIYTYSRSESIFPAGTWRLAEYRNHIVNALYLRQVMIKAYYTIFIFSNTSCWGTALVTCAQNEAKAEFLLLVQFQKNCHLFIIFKLVKYFDWFYANTVHKCFYWRTEKLISHPAVK